MQEVFEKIIRRLEKKKSEHIYDQSAFKGMKKPALSVFCGHKVQGLDEAIEIVNQLAEEYNDGWIPCSERLPEVEADVLLSLRSLDVYTGFRANTEGCFYVEGEGYVEYENVLAWQSLPAPYQPKGE